NDLFMCIYKRCQFSIRLPVPGLIPFIITHYISCWRPIVRFREQGGRNCVKSFFFFKHCILYRGSCYFYSLIIILKFFSCLFYCPCFYSICNPKSEAVYSFSIAFTPYGCQMINGMP